MRKFYATKRKFGNVTYDLHFHTSTKREAEQDAKDLRKKGRLVRIVPSVDGGGTRVYLIYTAFK